MGGVRLLRTVAQIQVFLMSLPLRNIIKKWTKKVHDGQN